MIGVFDSGFGGLTTLRELIKMLPEYDYTYLGDSANAPYGNRSSQTVTRYTEKGVEFLFSRGAKIVLLACNTASTDALRFLQEKYMGTDKKVLGVLIPASEKALENSRYGRIGVVGTRGTVNAGNFEKEISKRAEQYYKPKEKKAQQTPTVISQSCPLLVPLIEEGWTRKPETTMIVKKYVHKLKTYNIDTLILGCTHYPLLEKIFQKKMGKNCRIIDSGKAQAEKFYEYLESHSEMKENISENQHQEFFTTDCPEKFQEIGSKFLGQPIRNAQKIEI